MFSLLSLAVGLIVEFVCVDFVLVRLILNDAAALFQNRFPVSCFLVVVLLFPADVLFFCFNSIPSPTVN